LDDQLLADVVVTQDSPAGALQTQCCGGELVLELLEGAEVAVDGLSQLAGRLAATVRGEVLPEDGVVGVATKVERKVLGQRADLIRVGALLACLLHSLESSVGTLHIGVVVLGVVQLHNFGRDVRLQCVVCVWELRQRVLSHCSISPSEFVEKVLIITNGRTSTFIPAWPLVTNCGEKPGVPQG